MNKLSVRVLFTLNKNIELILFREKRILKFIHVILFCFFYLFSQVKIESSIDSLLIFNRKYNYT